MPKAIQHVERLEYEPRSTQALFLMHQPVFLQSLPRSCPHAIQEWCSECGGGSGCGQVLLLFFPSI